MRDVVITVRGSAEKAEEVAGAIRRELVEGAPETADAVRVAPTDRGIEIRAPMPEGYAPAARIESALVELWNWDVVMCGATWEGTTALTIRGVRIGIEARPADSA